jgi:hypothetical protein
MVPKARSWKHPSMSRPCSATSTCAALRPRRPYPLRASHRRLILFTPSISRRLLPLLPAHMSSAAVDRAVPLRHPEQLRHENPPQLSSPRPTPLSSKEGHRRSVTGAVPLPPIASTTSAHTGPPRTTPAPPQAPPEHRTPFRPNTRTPTTAGHLLRTDPLRPTAHNRRATATVSLLSPFASNRSHHRPGPLPGYFPANQRRPAGRISPASRRRQGRNFPPLFPTAGPDCRVSWAAWPNRSSSAVD